MSSTVAYSASVAGSEKPDSLHDSARGTPEPQPAIQDKFQGLVDEINTILEPSNGLDIDIEELQRVMASYESEESEWAQYAFGCEKRPYTRNLVDAGNGRHNLLILVWRPDPQKSTSPIHDHANAHCVMKVLKGALTETQYHWPCYNPDTKTACATTPDAGHLSTVHTCSHGNKMGAKGLQIKRQTTYGKNEVTYISDRIGLHSVGNASKEKDDYAVSLHLYTPPYAAKYGCHTYNPETGKKSDVKHKQCHFFSEYGVKMED